MKSDFENWTLKIKLTYILLYCLDYGFRFEDSDEKIKNRLKVEFNFDPKRIRSCIDLIQDTETAIISFAEYGLQKFSIKNSKGDGELYIRLYGILNAIYLQFQSIIELYEVLKIPEKNNVIRKFKKLAIFEIRNIAAAHTVNYDDNEKIAPEGFSKNFFRITQMLLTAKSENLNAVDGFGNVREFNLYQSFLDYNQVAEKILYEGIMNYLNRLLQSENKRKHILEHYEINGLTHFDYTKLYKNDKSYKEYLRRTREQFTSDFGDLNNEKINEILSEMSNEEMQEILNNDIEQMKNRITPPNNGS